MTTTKAPPARSARLLLDGAAIALLVTLLVVVALAFAWPWLPRPAPGGQALERYAPLHDGDSALVARYDARGELRSWTSQNVVILPWGPALTTSLREAPRNIIYGLYLNQGETEIPPEEAPRRLGNVQALQVRQRELDMTGAITTTIAIFLREPRGLFLVGYYDAAGDRDILFDPPAQFLPADLHPESAWETRGRFFGAADYTLAGRVLEAGPFESQLGHFADCVKIERRLVLSQQGNTIGVTSWHDWQCAGVGTVDSQEFDSTASPSVRTSVIATDRIPADPKRLPPPVGQAPAEATPGDPANWHLARVGRTRPVGETSESTISPVWIPTRPPILLAADYAGDLVAFDAADPAGSVLWRFHPEGTIYGPPAFDPARGRIYFGASDKRLYAVDARGLFIWAFETGDSVASRPLVVSDTVVFGSEDRTIYALDASTGAPRWTVSTGGPVVSSPALAGDVVIIGADDGAAYGLDLATGAQRWLFATDDAIEAPIVVADGTAYVASRDGTLYALDGATGEELWAARIGPVLRTAPAVGARRAFVVDDYNHLTALDRATGRRLWTTVEAVYVGPPVLVGQTLVVAGADGKVYRLDLDGKKKGEWDAAGASIPTDGAPGFKLGPALADGAIWLTDNRAVVRRLGPAPPQAGPAPLSLVWFDAVINPPFDQHFLSYTAVEYRGQALVLDEGKNVYQIDPATGKGKKLGTLGGDAALNVADPVVAGDTLIVIAGDTLSAVTLPDLKPLWQFRGRGTSNRPVTVAGQTVLWLTEAEESATGSAQGTLYALDLASGALRWQAPLERGGFVGGALVHGGTLFVSTPPAAFDLATGELRWQADIGGQPVAGPALDEAGETLFVGLIEADGQTGAVAAINTEDGSLRWHINLGKNVVSPFEPLWLRGEALVLPFFTGIGSNRVVALDAATGAERWHYDLPGPRLGALTVTGNRVWLALKNGHMLALDVDSGQPVARFSDLEVNLSDAARVQRPALIGHRLILPVGSMLLGFEVP
ncbi:MAG: PQQ-binding-like beta-propeller repeat protein [Ardenticatenaceae bacterium]|nr:PQQ-binding-like beta-propeller repeat protein [Ardenticatenaceae bacterium]